MFDAVFGQLELKARDAMSRQDTEEAGKTVGLLENLASRLRGVSSARTQEEGEAVAVVATLALETKGTATACLVSRGACNSRLR